MLISKNKLRRKIKQLRKTIVNKNEKDLNIMTNLINLSEFKNADTIICYSSYKDEIDTNSIINYCFENNKKVALPYCTYTI